MRFHIFMGSILIVICIGVYAMKTDKTVGDLCRNTGRGFVSFAFMLDGPGEVRGDITHAIGGVGRSIKDACSFH